MVLEKMIDELYELSKRAIASGIHVSFEIGLAGYPCRVIRKITEKDHMSDGIEKF